jgi:hypothetical protein
VLASLLAGLYPLKNANSLRLFQISANLFRVEFPTTCACYAVPKSSDDRDWIYKDRHRTMNSPRDDRKNSIKAIAQDVRRTNVLALLGAPEARKEQHDQIIY